jgi:hypothetical protein
MKKEKQARRENSGAAVKIQTQTPADDGGGNADARLARLAKAISTVSRELDEAIAEPQSTQEEIRLLCLRQWTEELEDAWLAFGEISGKEAAPGQAAGPVIPPSEAVGNADSLTAQFVEVLARINQEINAAIEESECTRDEIRLLIIRQWTEQEEDKWREMALGHA